MKFIVFLVVLIAIQYAEGIICRPDICLEIRCTKVTPETCSGPNKEIRYGACRCCKICYTYLEEGESCPPVFNGGMQPTSGCRKGLICREGICGKR